MRAGLVVRAYLAAFALGLGLVFALLLGPAACSVDPESNPAFGCKGCEGSCVMGFCLQVEDGGVSDGAVPMSGMGGGGGGMAGSEPPPPEACTEPGETEFCYEGPGDTATVGTCKAGMHVCSDGFWGTCLGQVLPEAEQCNREDDDCDGEVDEEIELGTCSTGQFGVCDVGMLQCEAGITVCGRSTDPGAEQCNGDDDDCDGELDEEISAVCYPAAPDGCEDDGEGGFTCQGLCRAGVASCVDGEPQPCDGVVEPATEECGSSGAAQDEDCDGVVDNGCTCGAGDSQTCYMGPEDTLGVGECVAGTQTCDTSTNMYGECEDDVLPGSEDCSNDGADDDCNGIDDDILRRGEPCTVVDAMGVCRDGMLECGDATGVDGLVCLGPGGSAEVCNELDDDCDGRTDEGLLGTDAHCTGCGKACDDGTGCCGGTCVNTDDDPLNCGRCNGDCGAGIACCDGKCTNLSNDAMNCMTCGRECPLGGCCENGSCSTIAICF